jgi:dihydrofolate synthase/folylpolyglutamate synthase
LNERISIGGHEIDDDSLTEAFEIVREACERAKSRLLYPPTFFERVTAMAFCFFRDRVDHAVLEVGLGGRLDATNIVRQDVSVITSLGLDHQEHLGTTLEEIAYEKGGIIKESEPVVVGAGCDLPAIRDRAGDRIIHADALEARVAPLGAGYFQVDLTGGTRSYAGLRPRMAGRHQIENLKVAVRAAECLEACGWPLDATSIERGVNTATAPGRMERLELTPAFVLDGGHNVAAARALRRFLDEYHPEGVSLVFGSMQEKDSLGILSELLPSVSELILTHPSNERAADPALLAPFFPGAIVTRSVPEAIRLVRGDGKRRNTVVVTGSLYLVGEVRALLDPDGRVEAGES